MASRRRTTIAAALSVGMGIGIPGVVLLAGFGLGVLDPLRHIDTTVTSAAAARKAVTGATVTPIPALTDLTAALTSGPDGWAGEGKLTSGASLPTVATCVPSPITPVVTVSRGFTVPSAQVTVTLAAFVAGAGAAVFDSQQAGIPGCPVPGGSSTVAAGPADGPGTASFTVATSQAGSMTNTVIWRRGDVLAYLSGSVPTTEDGLVGAMDEALQHALGNDCADQGSLATDAVRDPFAVIKRSDFKGLTVDQGINQVPTPLPSPTQLPGSAAVSGAASPAGSVQVSIGPLGVALATPSPATTPSRPPWPVYPPLPTELPVPPAPSVPASEPPTHAPLRESQVDSVGPGCGWAFTGMLPPVPPTVLSAATLAAKRAALQPLLARDQAKWQSSVNAYWVAYTAYIGEVQNYATYTDQVNQVSAAWAVIDSQWTTYLTLKAAYQQMVTDRKNFLTAQAAAQQDYAASQALCATVPPAVDPGVAAAPMVQLPRAGTADTPTPSAASTTTGAPLPPSPTASAVAPATTAPAAPPTDTAPAAIDTPPVTATTAPAAPQGVPCETPPTILAETPPPTPSGPPPTKPADPRPSKTPGASGAASAKATPPHP